MRIYEIKAVAKGKRERFNVLAPHSCKAAMLALDLLFPDMVDSAPIPASFSITVKCRSKKQ